jgi:hypothetical protein
MPTPAEQPASATADPDTAAADAIPGPGPEYQLFELLASKDQLLDIQSQLVDSLISANPALDKMLFSFTVPPGVELDDQRQ